MPREPAQKLLGEIKEAEELLNFIQHDLGDMLLTKRPDQFYRQGSLQLTKELAEEALHLASSNKFNTEIDSIRGCITFLDDNLDKNKLVVPIELKKSSSETCCSE